MTGRRIRRATGVFLAGLAGVASIWIAAPAPAAERGVRIGPGNQFDPKDKFIEAGDTVLWTYDDPNGAPHSVTRTSNPERFDSSPSNCPQSNPLQSPDCLNSSNRTYKHRFDTPGNYPYFCKVHSDMSGVIYVAAEPTGSATPTPTPTKKSPSPSASASPSPTLSGLTPVPTTSSTAGESPTPAPTETPLPRESGGGSGGKAALALVALAGLGGAGFWIYRRFLAPG